MCHLTFEKWWKIQIYMFVLVKNLSIRKIYLKYGYVIICNSWWFIDVWWISNYLFPWLLTLILNTLTTELLDQNSLVNLTNYLANDILLSMTWQQASIFNITSQVLYRHMHYSDVMMGMMVSQITNLPIVYLTVYSGGDQRKHQSSASLAFVRGIQWPVTREMFPFDDVIMGYDYMD